MSSITPLIAAPTLLAARRRAPNPALASRLGSDPALPLQLAVAGLKPLVKIGGFLSDYYEYM